MDAALSVIALVALMAGCAHTRDLPAEDHFAMDAPFSKTIHGSGDTVCWSVKRALLSQGYMLDRSADPSVMVGSRDFQPEEKRDVTVRMQTACSDNHDGTSVVFVTASEEVSRLQKMRQSTSAGIGPATITMPSGSAKVLGVVSRKTIQDPDFYNRFFALVEQFTERDRPRGAALESSQPDRSAQR